MNLLTLQLLVDKKYASESLSNRELEILSLSIKGYSCKVIASQLHISEETVKTHRKNILRKFGLSGKKAFQELIWQLKLELFQLQGEDINPKSP